MDDTIPFEGRVDKATGQNGTGTSTINVPLWREQWAIRNGCYSQDGSVNATVVSEPYDDTTKYVWDCNAKFIGYTVSTLGHSWPTTQGLDGSGAPNNTASFNITSPDILQFFTDNILPLCYLGQGN